MSPDSPADAASRKPEAPAAGVISGKPRRVGDEEGPHISIVAPWNVRIIVEAAGVLDYPPLGGSRSYQGMSGCHEVTAGAIAITVIGPKRQGYGE